MSYGSGYSIDKTLHFHKYNPGLPLTTDKLQFLHAKAISAWVPEIGCHSWKSSFEEDTALLVLEDQWTSIARNSG